MITCIKARVSPRPSERDLLWLLKIPNFHHFSMSAFNTTPEVNTLKLLGLVPSDDEGTQPTTNPHSASNGTPAPTNVPSTMGHITEGLLANPVDRNASTPTEGNRSNVDISLEKGLKTLETTLLRTFLLFTSRIVCVHYDKEFYWKVAVGLGCGLECGYKATKFFNWGPWSKPAAPREEDLCKTLLPNQAQLTKKLQSRIDSVELRFEYHGELVEAFAREVTERTAPLEGLKLAVLPLDALPERARATISLSYLKKLGAQRKLRLKMNTMIQMHHRELQRGIRGGRRGFRTDSRRVPRKGSRVYRRSSQVPHRVARKHQKGSGVSPERSS